MRLFFRLIRSALRIEYQLTELLHVMEQIRDQQASLPLNTGGQPEVWLSSKEVMARLHISYRSFTRLKESNKLTVHKMLGRFYYRQSEVDRCYE